MTRESYRDLLRTAEKIIEMDGSMQKVESNLAETSRNCNYRLMEKKARNVLLFQERVGARGLLRVAQLLFESIYRLTRGKPA